MAGLIQYSLFLVLSNLLERIALKPLSLWTAHFRSWPTMWSWLQTSLWTFWLLFTMLDLGYTSLWPSHLTVWRLYPCEDLTLSDNVINVSLKKEHGASQARLKERGRYKYQQELFFLFNLYCCLKLLSQGLLVFWSIGKAMPSHTSYAPKPTTDRCSE